MDTATPGETNDEVELLLTSREASPTRSGKFQKQANYPFTSFFAVQIALLVCYTAITIVVIQSYQTQSVLRAASPIPTFGREIKQYIVDSAPYFSTPSKEVDDLWHEILRPMNTRISKTELQKAGAASIPLQKSHGFLVQLGVFHELHCLKILRKWLFQEHYYEGLSNDEIQIRKDHCNHCLQLFFDAARCKGDTALTTFQWFASDPRPAAIFDGQHECIDWGKLLEWAEERHVSKDEMASLINPMYNGSSDA